MATTKTSNPAGSPKITDNTPRPDPKPQEFARFEDLASKVVNVPKSDVDAQRKP